MSNNKQNHRSFTGKGYYIALILCAAAIGISGYLYYRNQTNVQEVSVQESEPLQVILEEETAENDFPVLSTVPSAPESAPAQTIPAPVFEEVPREPEPLKTMSPVSGEELMPYSVEALSYNETTRDWRTHDGVDLAAEEGTEVCAAADGKVYTTYEDDTLGTTVVILHNGGYATRYASLGEELLVEAGDQVTMGQPIGEVGTTALVETAMGPHVHFSVTYRDTPMDPADFLSLS